MKTLKLIFLLLILFTLINNCKNKNNSIIKAPGVVNGDIITVKSKTAGTIIFSDLKEGKKIKKNDILIKLDNRLLKLKLSEIPLHIDEIEIKKNELQSAKSYALANKKYLLKQISRFKRLLKNKSISGEKLENLQLKYKKVLTEIYSIEQKTAHLDIEKNKLAIKEENLKILNEDFTLKSPINGVIIEKFVSNGENVFPTKPIVDILDLSSVFVEVFIEESEITKLKIGDSVTVLLDGIKKKFKGKISFFGRKAEFSPKYVISEKERKSLLYLVKIKIEKPENFKMGMPVTIVF